MALNAFLTLKGQRQGQIKGSVVARGKEDTIMVIAVDHAILSPFDPATGLPAGRRQHKPLLITKELDRSSPLLYEALVKNENMSEFTLRFFTSNTRATAGGATEAQHYTVKLTNARIVSIEFKMPNTKDPDLVRFNEYEQISFTYEKIEWSWTDGGLISKDDWRAPVV